MDSHGQTLVKPRHNHNTGDNFTHPQLVDFTLITTATHEGHLPEKQHHQIICTEVQYTSDTNTSRAEQQKEEHYRELFHTLRQRGHSVSDNYMILNTLVPFEFGIDGPNYLDPYYPRDDSATKRTIENFEFNIWHNTINNVHSIAKLYWNSLPRDSRIYSTSPPCPLYRTSRACPPET